VSVELTPGETTLSQLEIIWRTGSAATLHIDARRKVDLAFELVAKAAAGNGNDTAKLQRNLILSHCCGVGEPLDVNTTRLMMVLKLLSLGRGASGVAWATIKQIENMLQQGVTPVVPDQGSVGASGDLAPLAHMAAAMMGEGHAMYKGERIYLPMPSWGPPRHWLMTFTPYEGMRGKLLWPERCVMLWQALRFAKAIAMATRVYKIPTVFVASRKSQVLLWIYCISPAAR